MGLLSSENPLIAREAQRFVQRWPVALAWVALMAVSLAVEHWLFRQFMRMPVMVGWLLFTFLRLFFRIHGLIALFLVLEACERERRSGGWAALRLTHLSPTAVLVGKLAIPFGFLCLLSLLAAPVTYVQLLMGDKWALWEALLIGGIGGIAGLLEDWAYCLTACLVMFRFGWNRPPGKSLLPIVGVLAALMAAIMVAYELLQWLLIAAMGSQGLNTMPQWSMSLAFHACFVIPAVTFEAFVAAWAYRGFIRNWQEVRESQ